MKTIISDDKRNVNRKSNTSSPLHHTKIIYLIDAGTNIRRNA